MFVQKTYLKKKTESKEKWYLIDGNKKILGRLATEVADLLRGKRDPQYTKTVDNNCYIVVTNCEGIRLTGNKLEKKIYYKHSNYVGGLKEQTAAAIMEKKPELLLKMAVKGMLPKNSTARKQMTKLKLFKGSDHPHEAQKPQLYDF